MVPSEWRREGATNAAQSNERMTMLRLSVPPTPMPRIEVAPNDLRAAERALSAPPHRLLGAMPRLLSLDAFRGIVILAMLLVNNLGDPAGAGYFWKHADWPAMTQRHAWAAWWGYATGQPAWNQRLAQLPLERYRLQSQLGVKRVQLRINVNERSPDPQQAQRLSYEIDQLDQELRAIDEEEQLA